MPHASELNRGRIRFSEHVTGRGSAMFEEACRLGLEGIISRRLVRRILGALRRSMIVAVAAI